MPTYASGESGRVVEALAILSTAYESAMAVNKVVLEGFGNRIRGYLGTYRDVVDGYTCFWSMRFRSGTGTVSINFPWIDPRDRILERPISVRTEGDVGEGGVDQLVKDLFRLFVEQHLKDKKRLGWAR